MPRWNQLVDQVRNKMTAVRTAGTFDMRPAWRALAYRDHSAKPEAIVRAQAFSRVLLEDGLYLYEDDRLCGSMAGWFRDDLSMEMTVPEYQQLADEYAARGARGFWSGWDHSLADYPTLLSIGVAGYISRIHESLKLHQSPKEQAVLLGMLQSLEGFAAYMQRWARKAAQQGKDELAIIAEHVALLPPRTFHEALQLVCFTHYAFVSEGRYAMALGRIDQYLYPFYQQDLLAGRLTRDEALELLCHMWVKLAEIGEIQNICIGGLTPAGDDATNELSYLCLEATSCVQSPANNLSARFHDKTPEEFYRSCFAVIRTGLGFPAIFNDHVLIPGLIDLGIPVEHANDYCMVGCIETMLPGRQPAWSDGRFNTPKSLVAAMQQLRGRADQSYELLFQTFLNELRASLTQYCEEFNAHFVAYPSEKFPDPFLSALTHDCIGHGLDINDGGAEYQRFHGIATMGLATISDSLAAVKKLVFDEQLINYDALMQALVTDFSDQEPLRQMLLNGAPKYGNDNDEVDNIAAYLVDWLAGECLQHKILDGGHFVACMAANVNNIDAGLQVTATPDGRHAGTPLSDAASPNFGCDILGPTAFLNSVAKPDYRHVLAGSVINMKFDPELFNGEAGEGAFLALMKTFVRKRVPELQFNFTSNETLLAAQKSPELYRNLVVRVSGFSGYFVQLSNDVQEDVIRRRAHTLA